MNGHAHCRSWLVITNGFVPKKIRSYGLDGDDFNYLLLGHFELYLLDILTLRLRH